MQIKNFTKDSTLIYKGIGILLIVHHNFFHWIQPLDSKENEWGFSPSGVNDFYHAIIQYPWDCVNILFSYLGHYGVQLFVFISGAGLALSMQNRTRDWRMFLVERLKKLYPLLITGFVFLFFYSIILGWGFLTWPHYQEFFYKLLFIHTLIPNSGTSLSGPWWFFALIFQLYVLFPMLYKIIKRFNVKAFVLICMVSYIWIYISQYLYSPEADVWLLQNAPGHLPEFALGVLIALNPGKRMNFIWVLLSFAVFSLGNFYKPFFPLTFLCITVVLYYGLSKIMSLILKTHLLKKGLFFYASISMVLFVIHGVLRYPFLPISGDIFWRRYLSAILFLIAATAMAILGNMMYNWMVKKLK